jgi:hypothetical protein
MTSKEIDFNNFITDLMEKYDVRSELVISNNQRILDIHWGDDTPSIHINDVILNILNYNNITFIRVIHSTTLYINHFVYYRVNTNGVGVLNSIKTEQDFAKYIRIEKLKEIIY